MNIRNTGKLEKLLKTLKFSDKNTQIALEYLSGEMADDSLLEGVEHQNFRQLGPMRYGDAWDHLSDIREKERTLLSRYLKLFWAIGMSTTSVLWRTHHMHEVHREFQLGWKLGVLPACAVAAMTAESVAWNDNHISGDLPWLHERAQNDPQTLEHAQSLSGMPGDNMKVCLAGILLAFSEDPEVIERQRDILLTNVIDSMDNAAAWLSSAQRKDVCDYIRNGDPTATVPVPPVVTGKNALYARHLDNYHSGLLGCACWLGQSKDARLRCALRFYLSLNPQMVLDAVTRYAPEGHWERHLDALLEDLPGGATTMLLYLAWGRWWIEDDIRKKLMRCCASGAAEALKLASGNEQARILEAIPEARQLIGDERAQICSFVGKEIYSKKQEVKDFLMGDGSLKASRKLLGDVSAISYSYPTQAAGLIALHRFNNGWDDFTCRCAVVYGIVFEGRGLHVLVAEMNPEKAAWIANAAGTRIHVGYSADIGQLEQLTAALLERELPLSDVLTMTGHLYDNTYDSETQKRIQASAYLSAAKPELISALTETLKKGNVFARQTAINALYNLAPDHPEAKEGVLTAAGDSSKQIKENLVTLFAGRPEWAEDYKKLLTAKKAAERLLAIQVLGRIGERECLKSLLETEKNAKVLDTVRAVLGSPEEAPVGSVEDIAAALVKGNKVKKLSWLIDQPLPKLHKTDGTDADENIRNAILLSYCELGRVGRSDTAAQLAAHIDANDLSALACQVYEYWYAAGAQAKHKWVLSFAAVFGGASMTQRLKTAINDWPNHQRGAIACDAVMALALSTDPAAIVIVDAISRKFKFRQVKQAAEAALKNAAAELGITAEELADRIVPDLGFGKDGKRIFDYGKRSFTVRLTPTLELDITNDAGKTVKNLPAPGKTDDPQAAVAYEEFKNMKKQIKTTVTAQRARLESALSVLRCWDTERWNALFVENPIMHQFAMSLIWGVYEEGKLTDTFRYMEDGSFNTVDEDEYELPAAAKIGLVHPVELDDETLDGWRQQLEDYEITQSLDQLNRPVYTLDSARAGEKTLEDFGGKMLNGLSLSGKLLGQGWYRGSVLDGGVFYTFYREDAEQGIGVELRFSGSAVGFDDGEPVTVYDAVFYRGTVRRGSYIDEQIQEENIVPLGEVPVRYYSEIIHHLTRATASSTESNESWRSDR